MRHLCCDVYMEPRLGMRHDSQGYATFLDVLSGYVKAYLDISETHDLHCFRHLVGPGRSSLWIAKCGPPRIQRVKSSAMNGRKSRKRIPPILMRSIQSTYELPSKSEFKELSLVVELVECTEGN